MYHGVTTMAAWSGLDSNGIHELSTHGYNQHLNANGDSGIRREQLIDTIGIAWMMVPINKG